MYSLIMPMNMAAELREMFLKYRFKSRVEAQSTQAIIERYTGCRIGVMYAV